MNIELARYEIELLVKIEFGEVDRKKPYYSALCKMMEKIYNGNAQTMFDLAVFYEHGVPEEYGINENSDKATFWYGQAARRDHVEACYYYGNRLVANSNQGEDIALAKNGTQYMEYAAEKGMPRAQHMIGITYTYGWGVEMSYKRAEDYLKKALMNGEQSAKDSLDILKRKMEL